MGEAKRRRQLGANISILKPQEAMERLVTAGKPMSLSLIGAGLIHQGMLDGTLPAKLMAEEATAERHLFRYAFIAWDRIGTGEYDPWQCTLCSKDYSGLRPLSVLGIVDHARDAPLPSKPAVIALVCQRCDSVSTAETRRRVEQVFGLYPNAFAEGNA
jgi:hypothetical protein